MARSDGRDLDQEARNAGYPGGRREREAFRRAVKAAEKAGAAAPEPPTPKAKYKPQAPGTPGGRGRKSATPPAGRTRNRWHSMGTGGRLKTTGTMANVLASLKSAARAGETVWVTVKGSVVKSYEGKPSDQGEAVLKGWSAETILAAIDAAAAERTLPPYAISVSGDDVRAGLAELLEGLQEYSSVTDITSVTIRAYR